MDSILEALRSAVVTRPLNLAELDPVYTLPDGKPVLLPVRVNWTAAMRKQGKEGRNAAAKANRVSNRIMRRVVDEKPKGEAVEALAEELDAAVAESCRQHDEWWSTILLITPEEVRKLADALPQDYWLWIATRVSTMSLEYEAEMVKKASAVPSE